VLRGFSELTLAAMAEAQRWGAPEVDTEHLLLGLLRQKGVVAQVFERMGMSVDDVRAAVESQLPAPAAEPAAVILSARAKRVMELAADEARAMGHRFIGSFHLLFALLREKGGGAAQTLEQFGVTLDKARQVVREYLAELKGVEGEGEPEVPQKEHPAPPAGKERRICLSLKTRHALLRAADKALSANTETIEFEHLLAAVRELQQEGSSCGSASPRRLAESS